jgi:phytoene synthase
MQDREALVEAARISIDKGSKSFALASKLFDRQTRERAWLLYAWCRKCDDIADGQEHGGALSNTGDAAARLNHIRALTRQAYDDLPTGDLAFDAFGLVARECAIPFHYAADLIEGFAMDAEGWRPQTSEDLLRYCYHVAGVVGKMMALVMGVAADDEETLAHANDLGLAFQLSNIARDVREDAEAGRCYLPQDWLDEVDLYSPALTHGAGGTTTAAERNFWAESASAARQRITHRLAVLAARHEASARIGARKLPFRSRWAVLSAAGIYGGIVRKVARRGARAWDQRVVTSKMAKAGWVVRAFWAAVI